MKQQLKFLPLLALALGLFLFGCNKQKDSELLFDVVINKGGSVQKTGGSSASGHLQFHSGYVTIREIVFDGELTGTNGGSKSITHEQVTTIDFATGLSNPPLAPVTIEAGAYRSPNLGIELQDENSTPCLVVEGDYTHTNSNVIPIRFEFNSGEVFEAEAASHTFVQDELAIGQLSLDPIFWFNTVPRNMLDNATIGSDGFITISETSNSDIFDICVERLDINTRSTFR